MDGLTKSFDSMMRNESMQRELLLMIMEDCKRGKSKATIKAVRRDDFIKDLRNHACPLKFQCFSLVYGNCGIGLEASKKIKHGDMVFKESAFVSALDRESDKRFCSRCFTKMLTPAALCQPCEQEGCVEEWGIRREMEKFYENTAYDIMNSKLVLQV